MSRRLSGALALTLALAVAAPLATADTVTLLPDAPGKDRKFSGKVSAESPTELTIGPNKVAVDQIESVSYDGPAGVKMTTAANRELAGKLADAAADYQSAIGLAEGNTFVAQAAAFARLKILVQTAPNEALSGLEAFAKANASSREIGPALDLLYRLAMARGDVDRADRAAALIEKVPAPWAADRAAIAKARVLIKRNKAGDALAALDRMIAGAKADSPKGREARLAKADALASQKKFDDAEALAREAINAAGTEDAEAKAASYNTLGDTLRAAGKPKDALLAYLHTDLLYARDKDEHARALAQIAALWRELKRDDRADEALDRLKHDYPSSPWLASAAGK